MNKAAYQTQKNKGDDTKMARKTVKVEIPTNPDELLKLLKAVLEKHGEDGADSPLKALAMANLATRTSAADAANDEANRLYRLAEIETKKRGAAFGTAQTPDTALFVLTQVRDMLLTIHKGNPQKLQNWGFQVVEGSATTNKPKTTKPS